MDGVAVGGIPVYVGSPGTTVICSAVTNTGSVSAGRNAIAGLPSSRLKERLPRISKPDTMIAPNPKMICPQGFSDCIESSIPL